MPPLQPLISRSFRDLVDFQSILELLMDARAQTNDNRPFSPNNFLPPLLRI